NLWRSAIIIAVLLLAGLSAGGQDASTTPTLEELAAMSLVASPEQSHAAVDLLSSGVAAGTLTPDEAIQLLVTADWAALEDAAAVDATLATLAELIGGIAAGTLTLDEALAALAAEESATAQGFVTAITQAGASEATVALAQALVAAGVPPGIVVRIVRQGLNQDALTEEEVQALLTTLGELADGDAWGQLANEIAKHGGFKHQDREKNSNHKDGTSGDPEEETEQNEHGTQGKEHGKSNGK
ncbi:MAG: hypothetical protein AB7V19_08315, partial [Candidatus Bipolaricaulia bacterium]